MTAPTTSVGGAVDTATCFRLDGRVAVVTGASSGIGQRFARVLDAAGAAVVVTARRADRLETLAAGLSDALPIRCDLAADTDIEAMMDTALAWRGRIDVVVNTAGMCSVTPALEQPVEEFARELRINLVGPFALAQRAARVMADQGEGSIINVASILGIVGVGQIPLAGYAASKGGLLNLTRELAAQWAPYGIRVNAIAPGWFETEMTADMLSSERGRSWVAARAPLGRAGDESELDGALLFLATSASSYVTGQVLVVDGGWTAI
jgi:NAD(P)-dependent dehydrogenase (short-subunit alcohol dehydrogenase family)